MSEENKKRALIIGGIILAFILLMFMLRKKTTMPVNGAGQASDTYYLTSNIPPIDSSGFTMPNFGPVTIGTGGSGGVGYGGTCGGCDMVSNFGNNAQLAGYLNNTSSYADAVNDALAAMNGYIGNAQGNTASSAYYSFGEPAPRPYSPVSQLPIVGA